MFWANFGKTQLGAQASTRTYATHGQPTQECAPIVLGAWFTWVGISIRYDRETQVDELHQWT